MTPIGTTTAVTTTGKLPGRHIGKSRLSAAGPPLPAAVGQMIVSRVDGASASAELLARVRSGEIGGVILFSENTSAGPAAVFALVRQLQRAASAGGQPPLLVMTDQEGGEVRRLSWAAPRPAPAAMTSSATAAAEGQAAGAALRQVGINLDLAPVADVERVPGSFLGSRAFGRSASTVTERVCAFAAGLTSAGVGYTLKHFPGLGRATGNTDLGPVAIEAPTEALRADYEPYLQCGSGPGAVVMVSNAIYPTLPSGSVPAVLAPQTYHTELLIATQRPAPTISDDLQAAALARQTSVAVRAAKAGLDLLMFARTESASAQAYQQLLSAARDGELPRSRVDDAYRAIEALKVEVAGGRPSAP